MNNYEEQMKEYTNKQLNIAGDNWTNKQINLYDQNVYLSNRIYDLEQQNQQNYYSLNQQHNLNNRGRTLYRNNDLYENRRRSRSRSPQFRRRSRSPQFRRRSRSRDRLSQVRQPSQPSQPSQQFRKRSRSPIRNNIIKSNIHNKTHGLSIKQYNKIAINFFICFLILKVENWLIYSNIQLPFNLKVSLLLFF